MEIEKMTLNEVVEGLKKADPKLEQHLKKLLKIATEKPKTFETIIAMLKFY